MPSDLSPALMTTTSVRTSTTVPLTMAPGLSLARLVWLCSNSSANDSVIWKYSVDDTDRRRGKHLPVHPLSACAGLRLAVSVVVGKPGGEPSGPGTPSICKEGCNSFLKRRFQLPPEGRLSTPAPPGEGWGGGGFERGPRGAVTEMIGRASCRGRVGKDV